jgi:hypothetical protein
VLVSSCHYLPVEAPQAHLVAAKVDLKDHIHTLRPRMLPDGV